MFRLLGRTTYCWRYWWLGVGLAVLLVGIFYGTKVFKSLKDGGIDDPATSSALEAKLQQADFPNSKISIVLLAKSRKWTVDQPEFQNLLKSLLNTIKSDPSSPTIVTYFETHKADMVSKDRHSTFALIQCSGDQDAAFQRINRDVSAVPGLDVRLGGPAAADVELNAEVQKDLPRLGSISLPLLLILLLIIFRSFVAAALPLLIGAISVLGTFALLRVICLFTDISIFAANIVGLLGLGLAVDYSLLYVSRFRDELAAGNKVPLAIETATATAGEAIFLSGTTVAMSLLGMLAFPEMFLRSMGLGGALAVVIAMFSSLTVLPAILSMLGRGVDFLAVPILAKNSESRPQRSLWRALGIFVVRRPVQVLSICLAVLIASGVPFLHVRFANPGPATLPASFSARQVSDNIDSEFPKSENPPVDVLLTLKVSPISVQGIGAVRIYFDSLSHAKNVVSVDGFPSAVASMSNVEASRLLEHSGTESTGKGFEQMVKRYVSGSSTIMTVDYASSVDGDATQNLVRRIRSLTPPAGAKVLVGGDSAELVDRLDSLQRHLPTALCIIFLATFAVLLVMLSSLVIPIKAIVLNTLSLSAAFGLMTWIFQEGHLHRLLHFTPSGSLDPTLPVLIFAIAFGLATDYEVFLVSRIKEEYRRSGINSDAVVIGVEKTGGIITSAGLLLVVVVAAFGFSDILSMKEMGVGLAVAVTVDAAIVRTFLVPAAMQLFGKVNWWLPWKKDY